MTTPRFGTLDELKHFIIQSSLTPFREAATHFSTQELIDSVMLLDSNPAAEGQEKLEFLFQSTNSPSQLKSLGHSLSSQSFLYFLQLIANNSVGQDKLNLLLIGLPPHIFSDSLRYLHTEHLKVLWRESLLEPLHFQLIQFIHQGEKLKATTNDQVHRLKQDFLQTSPLDLFPVSLSALIGKIDELRDRLIDYLERASTALAIVWHTERVDLIEKLSTLNESLQYQLTQLIGHSAFDNLPPTGLYLFLDEHLSSVFDSSLQDHDSSVEGVTRLNIWNLTDYWELGLLPSIQHPQELQARQASSVEGVLEQDPKIASMIQSQLEHLGIGKVKDLKRLHLYSKHLLKAYIQQHRQLIV